MDIVERILDLELPPGQSAFLWGPRKTGKTTYLRRRFPESVVFDLLDTDLFFELAKRPSLLRERLAAQDPTSLDRPVIIDEVQKVPRLLDEVHWLIENRGLRFVLCGSSARKLRRGNVNLLGGRAWRFEMFPLVFPEVRDLDLLRVLNRGMVPAHYLGDDFARSLRAYARDYLKEEVFAEGLTRNLPAFSRFFDAMAYSHGELTNYSNVARECGVDSKTVKEYYQILVDTLLGSHVLPFKRRQNRQVISRAPKFYLFDVGVAGSVTRRSVEVEAGEEFGRALEHFIFMELSAHRSYTEKDYEINFWRTKSGLEVDFVLGGGEVAIEVKGASRLHGRDLLPLKAFVEEHNPGKAIVVSTETEERVADGVRIMSWKRFLNELWNGDVIT
jgi:predicted AAA+ superfamily ATPase